MDEGRLNMDSMGKGLLLFRNKFVNKLNNNPIFLLIKVAKYLLVMYDIIVKKLIELRNENVKKIKGELN